MNRKDLTLHMVGNAHIDPVWLWRWDEGFQEVMATFRSALDRMQEYDDFVFSASSAAFYEWIEQTNPQMFAEISKRVAEGRWQIVGGWWIEPDCNIPGGESFVRQGLYGQRYFKEKFGRVATVGFNVDSFGHSGMLPQILKKSGINAYVFMRPSPHEKGLPGNLFWWEADDGSRVLAFRILYEYCSWPADISKHVLRCAAAIKAPFDSTLCFYGVGNHGGGPTVANVEHIHRMDRDPDFPRLVFAEPAGWLEREKSRNGMIPVVHDDLQHHASGCYSAHSGIKRWNRQAENLLLTAERWATIASWVTGQAYPDNFAQAWKDVLFNQFHDIMAGTAVEAAYEDARDLYGEARSIAGRGLNLALQSLAWNIGIAPEADTTPIVVFNPHTWASDVPVELEYGMLKETDVLVDDENHQVPMQTVQPQGTALGRNRISFVAALPPLGYRVYRVRPAADSVAAAGAALPLEASDTILENARFRLEFDSQTGCIKSLFDKAHGQQVFLGSAAQAVVIDDPTDTWGHNTFKFDRVVGAFTARSVRLVENGAVKAVIRVISEYGASRMIQDFTLYRKIDRIDVHVTLDWRERFKMLKLRFPVNVNFMRATYEIPYGHIQRFANGEEEPGQSWIDLSGVSRDTGDLYGLSILNDGKYSFDVNVRDIGLTVLRSPVYANHMPVIPQADGDYAFLDQGIQHFSYCLLPHAGSWEGAGTVRRAAELNQGPLPLIVTYHPHGELPQQDAYMSVDAENIVISVVKQAEDGNDMILRAYESAGTATTCSIRLGDRLGGRVVKTEFGPCEIKTLRIPRDIAVSIVETNMLEWTD